MWFYLSHMSKCIKKTGFPKTQHESCKRRCKGEKFPKYNTIEHLCCDSANPCFMMLSCMFSASPFLFSLTHTLKIQLLKLLRKWTLNSNLKIHIGTWEIASRSMCMRLEAFQEENVSWAVNDAWQRYKNVRYFDWSCSENIISHIISLKTINKIWFNWAQQLNYRKLWSTNKGVMMTNSQKCNFISKLV